MEEEAMSEFRIGSLPTLYYIPDFVTSDEEILLLNNINQAPLSKWKTLKSRRLQNWGGVVHEKGLLPQNLPLWLLNLTRRISETTGLFPSAINHVLINEYLPDQGIMPHQDGPAYFPVVAILSLVSPAVMDFTPHSKLTLSDSSKDQNRDSCLEASEMEPYKWVDNHHPFSVLLMPRSLLIFKDEAYSDYLHGIKDSRVQQIHRAVNLHDLLERNELDQLLNSEKAVTETNTGDTRTICRSTTRISLTCRLVMKYFAALLDAVRRRLGHILYNATKHRIVWKIVFVSERASWRDDTAAPSNASPIVNNGSSLVSPNFAGLPINHNPIRSGKDFVYGSLCTSLEPGSCSDPQGQRMAQE